MRAIMFRIYGINKTGAMHSDSPQEFRSRSLPHYLTTSITASCESFKHPHPVETSRYSNTLHSKLSELISQAISYLPPPSTTTSFPSHPLAAAAVPSPINQPTGQAHTLTIPPTTDPLINPTPYIHPIHVHAHVSRRKQCHRALHIPI